MSLNIVSQPGTPEGIEFYKDEGGKSNWMTTNLVLQKTKNKYSHSSPQLELRAHLYFESGLPVEASDQKILLVRFNGHTTSAVVPDTEDDVLPKREILINTKDLYKNNGGMTVEFRIQKVSRRKDNQRFVVQLSTSDDSIPPVYTRPITVLSKRKIPARLRNDPEAIVRYKAEKMSKAQSNRAAGKRSRRSTEATPELRPLTVAKTTTTTFNKGSSKKRARVGDAKDLHLKNKIDQMSHTINQLYDMMQDQRIQINLLQDQVRMLNDSNMGLGFAVLDGVFEDGTNSSASSSSSGGSSSGGSSSSSGDGLSNVSQIVSTMMATNTMLTGLDMLSNSSEDISTTFDDSTEKTMVQNVKKETALEWNFNPSSPQVSMPPLPVLNL